MGIKKQNKRTRSADVARPDKPTLRTHIRELQLRVVIVAAVFIAASCAAYPFFERIVEVLVAPLGQNSQLVYLTPGGAFGFMIQVCIAIGLLAAVPVAIYQIYRFLAPAVRPRGTMSALLFSFASVALAAVGVAFGYFVGLPAALHFLTGFEFYHVDPMLTIDSYFSFVMTYVTASALLFQLPLAMLVINSVTPLSPGGLMRHQDKMIIASFIFAAIISPTPDALNQTLLASPIVVMYQVGIMVIWLKNRRGRAAPSTVEQRSARPSSAAIVAPAPVTPQPIVRRAAPARMAASVTQPVAAAPAQPVAPPRRRVMSDFVSPATRPVAPPAAAPRTAAPSLQPSRPLSRTMVAATRSTPTSPPRMTMRHSVDGFVRVRS